MFASLVTNSNSFQNKQEGLAFIYLLRNASNMFSYTSFPTHTLLLVAFNTGQIKFMWDPHSLPGPTFKLTGPI